MNILHFLSHFSLLSETFIYDEMLAMEKTWPGANLIATFHRQLPVERPFPRVQVLNQSPSFLQNLHRRCLRRVKGLRIPREHFPLCAFLREQLPKTDALQAHFGWNGVTLWQALKFLGEQNRRPLIVRCHGSDISSNPRLYPDCKTVLLEMARAPKVLFTANSEFLARKLIELGVPAEKVHPVALTFNDVFSEHRKKRFFRPGDRLRLINTARFIEWKGQRYLIEAFARFVREVHPNAQLTLIGEGETLAAVKQLASDCGVRDKVVFAGGVAHQEVPRHLSESDIYIQPSIQDPKTFQEESFGVAILEALAVGLPVIITRTGGMPEIVGGDGPFARIVPDRDADALFEALKEMFTKGTCFQDITDYSRNRLAQFTPERQLKDLTAVYHRMGILK